MPSRYRRARLDPADPKIRIRARYMEAIRAGATIADATIYANADPETVITFTKSAVVSESPPQSFGQPGERSQMLPLGWAAGDAPPPALPAVDTNAESVKRPGAAPEVSPPKAVSTPAETKPATETVAHPSLPTGWDTKDFEWPKLRGLCMAMGLPTPNSRGGAVKAIRAHLTVPQEDAAAAA